jgi:uncharacterized membrane protein YeaQ/YmgE (transglycosylase-associated protein family)
MDWIWYVLLGAVIGIIARLIHPGKENMGWIMTVLIGIGGAILAGLIGQFSGWFVLFSGPGFGVAIVLAVVMVAIYARMKAPK